MLASAVTSFFSAVPQRWIGDLRIGLSFDSVTPTNIQLTTSPYPNQNTMSCTSSECMVVDCKVSVFKIDCLYMIVSTHDRAGV